MAALLALFAATLTVQGAAASTHPGKALFDAAGCRACHGIGNVGGNAGPDLTFVGFRRSRAWLAAWLADPHAWKPDTLMPDFKLSDGDRGAIVDYLAQLRGQDFGAHRPWLNEKQPGRALFARAGCVACHGPEGRGGHPNVNVAGGQVPALPALVRTYTRDELIAKIRRGAKPDKLEPNGPEPAAMPPWGEVLIDDELGAVADYLLAIAGEPGRAGRQGKEDW